MSSASRNLVRKVIEEGHFPSETPIVIRPWSISKAEGLKIVHLEGMVLPGLSSTITYVQATPSEVRRIAIHQNVGQFFEIVDVRVGKESQFVTPGTLPATHFEPGSAVPFGPIFDVRNCDADRPFSMTVKNISDSPRMFSGALVIKDV